ncbi:MAG: hypothetical protein KKH41_07580 [Candidatus Thermoplasmatota archaeon]|nr:hypothetical protein [Euryarchaeota archaeon]MBU4031227.1 hypothetical protein [Candidatus Thermoplasmatota archaeon]MBU4143746.1 hypothetical protein [Candidatus Thermoplasmatota archaeon]MBU4592429.1 hypothetical protein [Candidatus Thermoplasmatota archaeon]
MARKKSILILCTIMLIAFSFPLSQMSTATDGIENVQLHMPVESIFFNDANQMVMITGFWHILEFDVPSAMDASMELTKGIDRYEWTYNEGAWNELEHNLFIDQTKCSFNGERILFWIAVDQSAIPGIWHLAVNAGELKSEQDIELRERTGGVGFSTADFLIAVPPYTQMQVETADTGQYARVHNEDVVPVNVDFFIDNDNCIMIPGERTLSPLSMGEYSLVYSSNPLTSQRQEFGGEVLITYKYVGPSIGTAQLIPSYNYPFDIIIFVGDPDLEFVEADEYTVQYVTSVRMASNETRTFPLILDGQGDIDLDINGIGCTVSSIELNGVEVDMPYHLELAGDRSETFNIMVEPIITSGNASLVYQINGDQYTTVIEIDSTGELQEKITENYSGYLNKVLPPAVIGVLIVGILMMLYKRRRRVKS